MVFRVSFDKLDTKDFIREIFQDEETQTISSSIEDRHNTEIDKIRYSKTYKISSVPIDSENFGLYYIIENAISKIRISEKINRIERKQNWKKRFIEITKKINKDSIKNMDFFSEKNIHSVHTNIENKIYNCINSLNKHLEEGGNNTNEDEIYENTRYSLINFLSKYTEIEEVFSQDLSFSIDEKSGCISLDIIENPIGMSYDVVLNMKFLSNGNVSFVCYDGDNSDDSYINGIITKHKTYMSNHKFKSILLLAKQGE